MEVFVGFEFNDGETAVAIEGEEIEHAAVAAGKRRHLTVEGIAAQARQQVRDFIAKPGFEPPLRLKAEEGVVVRAGGMAAEKKPREEVAAEGFVFIGQGRFVCTR